MITEILVLLSLPLGGVLYFLHSNYNSVYKRYQTILQRHQISDTPEVNDPITLNLISGQVPSWLNGIMYRIGPGKFNIQQKDGSTFSIKHAFDGLPFMHRFEINGQTQTLKYNSRMLCKSIEREMKEKTYTGLVFFGHIPIMSFPQWIYHFFARLDKFVLRPRSTDNIVKDGQAVGVTATPNYPLPSTWKKDNQRVLVSKTDANVLQKIHAETLEPERVFSYTTYDNRLKGQFSAAHHQWDPNTKEAFNFALTFAPTPRIIVFSTSESGQISILADFANRTDNTPFQASYIHSLWLTENYVIIPECSLTYHDKGVNILLNGSALSSMTWLDNTPTYFHVIRRSGGGLVASIPGPAFFTFHVGNAFDTIDPVTGDALLTLDCASFADGDIMNQLHNFGTPHRKGVQPAAPAFVTRNNGIAHPPKQQTGFGDFVRYKLNMTQSKFISAETLVKNLEFPRFNQVYSMKSTCEYVYGCELKHFTEKMDESGGLIKLNTVNGEILRYGEEGFSCSEPIFVPSPDATKEDDGVLLTLVNNFDCCYLIVVDAKEMKELARFRIGQFTAVTFHGSYVDHEFESININ